MRAQAERNKKEARLWAAKHGLPMRRKNGTTVVELMAIREGRPIYYSTLNANAARSTGTDLVRDPGYFNITGQDVTVGIWDAGQVLSTHSELTGRAFNMDNVEPIDDHSTHVAGTIAAAGLNSSARGMAPDATIHARDWWGDTFEMASQGAAAPGQTNKLYLSNHAYTTQQGGWDYDTFGLGIWYGSWGPGVTDNVFGRYSGTARQWDEILYQAPYYLPFVAAGNERSDNPQNGESVYHAVFNTFWDDYDYTYYSYDSSSHPAGDGVYKGGYDSICNEGALAKNVLSVGAVDDAVSGGTRSVNAADMTTYSSWGPADDGRIKPDIVANGYSVYSCADWGSTSYTSKSGTSMAAANASGSAALLIDYYRQRLPGQDMRASTLKGLIIHTADDLGNPGPDYKYGWGLMNTVAAAELINDYASNYTNDLIEGRMQRIYEDVIYSSGFYFTPDLLKAGTDPIRITLCWTDPPGQPKLSDDRTPTLTNDLQMVVLDYNGNSYYPYSLDYANPSAVATTNGPNLIDNVEQIYIANPEPGLGYSIMITCDGELVDGEQEFSLLISGTDSDSDFDGMTDDWEFAHFMTSTGAIATADSDGDGENNGAEYVSGHDPHDAASFFSINSWQLTPSSGQPFIVNWDAKAGREYNVLWSTNLISDPFSSISGTLMYPENSYTDTVLRAGVQQFYRVDVQFTP